MHRSLLLVALLAAAPLTRADGLLDLDADKPQSNFTWSGTTSLGPIVGNPGNAFQVDGHQMLSLAVGGGGAKWSAQLVSGDLFVTPDLAGKIPNPIPGFPPLATIDIQGMHLSLSAPAFDVLPSGSFAAQVTATVLSGSMTVTPLVGSQTVTDLAGAVSDASPQSGTIVPSGGGLHLASPIDLTFDFADPGSGVSGSITILGTLHADWSPAAPVVYCTAKTSSSGCTPAIAGSGTPSASATSGFTLQASQVEANKAGIFFFGTSGAASSPFQGGTLCAQPPLVRTTLQPSGGVGPCGGAYALDFNAWLAANKPGLRVPGQAFFVQCWFRDPADPVSGTGLSDALSFVLAP